MTLTNVKLIIFIFGISVFALSFGSNEKGMTRLQSVLAAAHQQTQATAPKASTQPAAETTNSNVLGFYPIEDARPGEWAFYNTPDALGIYYQIRKVRPSGVKTAVHTLLNGHRLGLPAVRQDPLKMDPIEAMAAPDARRTMQHVTIEIDEKSWMARLYEDRWNEEGVDYLRRTWASEKAPVFGVLRMELYGNDRLEAGMTLQAFGPETSVKSQPSTRTDEN